ncbi:hypothetical protein N9Y42_11180 [Mariniblastus sp.]|nr:hypothetical protein [Mariniblastus sp.]
MTTRLFTILLVSLFFPAGAFSQVFDLGPSDPDGFTNALNIPTDTLEVPASGAVKIGGVDGETTQVNVLVGGSIAPSPPVNVEEGGELNISGGSVDENTIVRDGGELNISSGTLGRFTLVRDASFANISGGTVGPGLLTQGGTINVSGGTIEAGFVVGRTPGTDGGQANISGGTISDLTVRSSDVNISGGTLNGFLAIEAAAGGGPFGNIPGSNVDLLGSNFALNGTPIDGLVVGEAFTINDRDVTLSGLLADGSPFSFDLNTSQIAEQDFIASNATLRVTVAGVLEPLLGDVNLDKVVDFSDIGPFIVVLSNVEFQAEADIDGNDTVDFDDIAPFIVILAGG